MTIFILFINTAIKSIWVINCLQREGLGRRKKRRRAGGKRREEGRWKRDGKGEEEGFCP